MTTSFISVDEAGLAFDLGRVDANSANQIGNALGMFRMGLRHDAASRRWNTHRHGERNLARHFDAVDSQVRQRVDSFNGGAGLFQPRDLQHKMAKILEQPLPPLNARTAFPVNTEVQPGAKSWEQHRFYGTGQAVVYRGGSGQDIPYVGLSNVYFNAPVVYMVSASSMDILEEMSAGYAGMDINSRKLARQRRAIMELQNKWTWEGSTEFNLYGLLNHPYIDTAVSQVDYLPATDAEDILADLYYWADYADNSSGGTFKSDTLLISNKLRNFLTGIIYPDTAGSNVLEMLLRHKDHIKNVIPIRELDDAGGAGVHVMAFVRRGTGSTGDTSTEIVSVMEPIMLPAEQGALSSRIFMLAGYGGLNAQEVGSMVTVYVNGGA